MSIHLHFASQQQIRHKQWTAMCNLIESVLWAPSWPIQNAQTF